MNNNIEVDVLVNGRPVRKLDHEGRTYVEARENSEYHIRINNRNGYRVKSTVSIDGLNCLNGQPASSEKDEGGYIIPAYRNIIIKGFRVNNEIVGAFKFVKKSGSYATENGSYHNGVIGIRIWTEKTIPIQQPIIIEKHIYHDNWYWRDWYDYRWPYWYPTFTCTTNAAIQANSTASYNNIHSVNYLNSSSSNCSCGASSQNNVNLTPQQDEIKNDPFVMGSTFGSKLDDKVQEASFETGELLSELIIYYTSEEGLKALGVPLTKEKEIVFPNAFGNKYCKPPKNWV